MTQKLSYFANDAQPNFNLASKAFRGAGGMSYRVAVLKCHSTHQTIVFALLLAEHLPWKIHSRGKHLSRYAGDVPKKFPECSQNVPRIDCFHL